MTTETTCDRDTSLAARRAAYEAEVARALLDESDEERAERVALARAAQRALLYAFLLDHEPIEN